MRVLAAWIIVLCALGCNSTGVGNPSDPATASLALVNDSTAEPNATDTDQLDTAQLKHAVLVFGKLEFIACDSSEKNVSLAGPFVVDLAQNRIVPAIPAIAVPDAGFCGIDATLAPATAPAALAGRSIYFSGTRSDGTLFLLFADMPGTLRLRQREDLAWTTDHPWLWAFRPRRWLSLAELDASVAEADTALGQVVVINANRHPLLFSAIRARLAGRSSLHLDLNGNLELDNDERNSDAFIGQGLENLD